MLVIWERLSVRMPAGTGRASYACIATALGHRIAVGKGVGYPVGTYRKLIVKNYYL